MKQNSAFNKILSGFGIGVFLYLLFAIFSTGYNIKVDVKPQQHVFAGALTDFAENKIVDATLRAQPIGTPVAWHVALYTTCPTDSTAGIEVSGGNYARFAVTAGLAAFVGTQGAGSILASSGTGGTVSNNAAWAFTAPTTWGAVLNCWGITDAATVGNIWIYSAITGAPKTVNVGDTATFAIGAATFQIDN